MNDSMKLLDCTLRDGGYINEWKWGFRRAGEIISALVKARVDIVEVGFLKNVTGYDPDITVCNRIEELNRLLPKEAGRTVFSAMAMRSNYDISKLKPYDGEGIEMIRITAHDYDIVEGMDFAQKVKEKGYKLSINPINIMGYSDDRLLWIFDRVNRIQPYQFSVVDTFGSMKRRDLDRIMSLADNNLDRNIRVALHLHENMSHACCLAQNFIDKRLKRPITVDGSLMGMGRVPGNLPIELIADYMNDYTDSAYDIDYLLDAIQDHIAPIKNESEWGYMPAYFLSARFNLHRNYAEHYLKKGDLTNKEINCILARIDPSRTTAFDAAYADKLYEEYKDHQIDDTAAGKVLKDELEKKQILVIAPGSSINTYKNTIDNYILQNKPVVISVNFLPEQYKMDFAFFSNSRRITGSERQKCRVIITSNLREIDADYCINYNSLSGAFHQGCNSLIMLLNLLRNMKVKSIALAGADGFKMDGNNYYNVAIRSSVGHDNKYNLAVSDAIRKLGVEVEFLTPSEYEQKL